MNMNTVWVAFIIQSSYNEVTIQILIEKNTYVITNFSNIERKLLCKSCSPDPTINFETRNSEFLPKQCQITKHKTRVIKLILIVKIFVKIKICSFSKLVVSRIMIVNYDFLR